jgi:hypothetical protein
VARGLGARSACELRLAEGGLDVLLAGRTFRIPARQLDGARHDQGIAGKVVPPHGLLVVSWRHGDHALDSGFRLDPGGAGRRRPSDLHDDWIRAIGSVAEAARGHEERGRDENHEEHTT